MKKVICLLINFLFLSHVIKAQDDPVRKGNVISTIYIGFPNSFTKLVKNTYGLKGTEKEQVSIKSFPPVGVSISYIISDHIAFGAEVNYSSAHVQWKETARAMYPDDSSRSVYNFNLQAASLQGLIKLNYHFKVKKSIDWYLGFGLGYNYTPVKLYTNAPYRSEYDRLSLCVIPISPRINVGYSYYVTQKIGINAEIGIGGPLVSVGIAYKPF